MIISTVLKKKFIEMDIFDESEAHKVLKRIQLILLGMRIPDLGFIILNDFNDIKKSDFFRT